MSEWHTESPRDYQMDPERHTPIDPHGTPLTVAELEARGWKVTTYPLPEEPANDADPPCRECGAPTDDGEGYDGYCGNCADRAEQRGEWGP